MTGRLQVTADDPTVVTLERMRWWHVDLLLPLEIELFGPDGWSAGAFWSELGRPDTRHYLVARDGAALTGYAGLCDYPDEAFVQTIAVTSSAQGRGVGDRLLAALLDEARRRRQRTVRLEVRVGNERAQRLYARHGFTRESVRRGYYQPSGEDAAMMVRRDRVLSARGAG